MADRGLRHEREAMPCNPNSSLVQAAVYTLIKEIVSTFEARRRACRRTRRCRRRAAREQDAQP
jgi:hypothetical protein